MTEPKEFRPGHGYSKEDWDAVECPPMTDEELANMRAAREVMPEEFFLAMEELRRASKGRRN